MLAAAAQRELSPNEISVATLLPSGSMLPLLHTSPTLRTNHLIVSILESLGELGCLVGYLEHYSIGFISRTIIGVDDISRRPFRRAPGGRSDERHRRTQSGSPQSRERLHQCASLAFPVTPGNSGRLFAITRFISFSAVFDFVSST